MNAPLFATVIALKAQIAQWREQYPEVFEDAEFAEDFLEGETDFHAIVSRLEADRYTADEMQGHIEALITYHKEEITRLRMRHERYERRESLIRQAIQSVMEAAGQTKVALPTATLSVRAAPPKVVVIDEAEIPPAYWRIKREVDKAALAADLKAGETIPGAALSNGGQTLAIRRT